MMETVPVWKEVVAWTFLALLMAWCVWGFITDDSDHGQK